MRTKTETTICHFALLAGVILWPVYLLLLALYLHSSKKGVQQFCFKFGFLNVSVVGSRSQPESKSYSVEATMIHQAPKPPVQEIENLIERHNHNLARFLETRDKNHLQETSCNSFLNLSESYFETMFDSMKQSDWTTCNLVTFYLIDNPTLITNNRLIVTTNETWEYFYTNGQKSQSRSVNKYTMVSEQHKWLVEACDIIADRSALQV